MIRFLRWWGYSHCLRFLWSALESVPVKTNNVWITASDASEVWDRLYYFYVANVEHTARFKSTFALSQCSHLYILERYMLPIDMYRKDCTALNSGKPK